MWTLGLQDQHFVIGITVLLLLHSTNFWYGHNHHQLLSHSIPGSSLVIRTSSHPKKIHLISLKRFCQSKKLRCLQLFQHSYGEVLLISLQNPVKRNANFLQSVWSKSCTSKSTPDHSEKGTVKLCNCTEEPNKNNSNNNEDKLVSNYFGHSVTNCLLLKG